MNNPYQFGNYGQFNPYQPVNQMQYQYQQPPRMPQVTGRIVNSVDEIMVQEVPTDGTLALFPAADSSCVFGKRWNPNGTIETVRFVPEAAAVEQAAADPFASINARIDGIFAKLEELSETMPKRQMRRTNKEADNAE